MIMIMMVMMMMACRHIPNMTKSHHGGNKSVMIKVGMCQCPNPTIHDKVKLGPVGSDNLFNSMIQHIQIILVAHSAAIHHHHHHQRQNQHQQNLMSKLKKHLP